MSDTKEQILMTALHLFARDGYEAVSVSTIAGELGMTKGALYRHYKNKRDIFDSIVERMFQIDAERAEACQVPADKYEVQPEAYENTSLESIRKFTLGQFRFWTEDDFASNFRKMLTLEQYRSPEMAELYSNCLIAGPAAYMENLFRELMLKGVLKEGDPGQLAVEFYAPLFLLIHISDGIGLDKTELNEIKKNETESHGTKINTAKGNDDLAEMLDRHIRQFMQKYMTEQSEQPAE